MTNKELREFIGESLFIGTVAEMHLDLERLRCAAVAGGYSGKHVEDAKEAIGKLEDEIVARAAERGEVSP